MANRRYFSIPSNGLGGIPLPQTRTEEEDDFATSGTDFVPNTLPENASRSRGEDFPFGHAFAFPELFSSGNARTHSGHRFQRSQPTFPTNGRPLYVGRHPGFQGYPNPDPANGYYDRFAADHMTSSGTNTSFGASTVPFQRSSVSSSSVKENGSAQNHTGGLSSPFSTYHPSKGPETAPDMTVPIGSTRSGSFLAPRHNSNRVDKKKARGHGAGNVPVVRRRLRKNVSKVSGMRKTKRLSSNALSACDAWIRKNAGKYPRDKVIHRLGGRYQASFRTLRKYFDRTLLKTASHQHASVSSDHDLVSYYRSNRKKCKAEPDWLKSLSRDSKRPFVCTSGCGRNFAERKQWIRHEETNWVQHIWKCPFPDCQPLRPSTRKDHPKKHLRSSHGNDHATQQELDDCHILITGNFPKACIFHDCGASFESWKSRNKHVGDHLKSDWDASQWRKLEDNTVDQKVTDGRTEEATGDMDTDEEESKSSQTENGSTSTNADYGSTNGSDTESHAPDDNPDVTGSENGDYSGDDGYEDQNPDPQPFYGPEGNFEPNTRLFFDLCNHLSRQNLRLAPSRESGSKSASANRAMPSLLTHAIAVGRHESKKEMREYIIEKYFREYSVFNTPSRTVQREQGLMADVITVTDDILCLSNLKISEAPIIPCGA